MRARLFFWREKTREMKKRCVVHFIAQQTRVFELKLYILRAELRGSVLNLETTHGSCCAAVCPDALYPTSVPAISSPEQNAGFGGGGQQDACRPVGAAAGG